MSRRGRIQWLGLLSIISFISYLLATVIAPIDYPNYNWMAQAVSDLSASDAPSRNLWNQLSAFYEFGAIVSVTAVVIYIEDKLNKVSRWSLYIFALMQWISAVGYRMFPLSSSGNQGSVQDIIHIYVITFAVILLSIISLVGTVVGSFQENGSKSLGFWALFCFLLMLTGAFGVNLVPSEYFGIPERLSVFSVAIFNGILGWYLWTGKFAGCQATISA